MEVTDNIAFGLCECEEFPENDTESSSNLANADLLETFLGKNFLNDHLGNTTDCKPFLYTTVEELSGVKSTLFWKNNNVRVLGRIFLENEDSALRAKLVSPVPAEKKTTINLNMDLLEYRYSQGRLVEVFGYFDADLRSESQLKVVNIVPANGVNIQSHYKVIKLRSKYVPEYNDENDAV